MLLARLSRPPELATGERSMVAFVMNTKGEIVQATTDYQAGRVGAIPAAVLG